MTSLLRIVRFTRALAPLYTAIIVCSVLTAVAGLAVPFLIGNATDTVAGAVDGETATGTAVRTVLLIAAAVLAAELAVTVISNIGGWFGDVMSNRMRTILSVRYYDKLLHLPQRWFDGEITGTIVARLNRSITEITNFTKMMSNSFASMLITTVAVLAISAWYAWPLTALLLIVFPVYVWLTSLTSVKWQRLEGTKNEQIDIASGRFAEVVGQIRVVKSFVRERGELADFSRRFRSTDATTREQSSHWHRMDVIRRAFLNLIFFGIYAIIFVRTVQGQFTLGEMVLLIQLMTMAKAPVESMSWVIDSAQRAIAGSKDYFRVMETPVDPRTAAVMAARPEDARDAGHADGTAGELPRRDTTGTAAADTDAAASASAANAVAPVPAVTTTPESSFDPVPGAPVVAFREVPFAYENGEDVLHGIDFQVDRGEKIALVGESGGGKSTIVNLLLGLYEPRRGSIEVVGRPSADLPLDQLRARIGGGLPGRLAVLRHHPRQHCVRPARGERRGSLRGRAPRQRRHLHPPLPGRLRAGDRGARAQALRRAASAHRRGPRDAQGRSRAGARRGDLGTGHQGRDPGAEGSGPADGWAYLVDHRPPPLHHRRGGSDHHPARRQYRRDRQPR